MSQHDLEAEALARHELHKNHPTHRPLSDDYELIGLRGEEILSQIFNVPMDMMRRPNGDGGIDNILRLNVGGSADDFVVDVKTAKLPFNLIVEVGKVKQRTIYILAGYTVETDTAYLIGWEWSAVVLRAPTKDFGYGVINHFIPRYQLRQIEELLSRHSPAEDDWADLLASANDQPESPELVMAAAGPPVSLPLPVHEPFIHNCACGKWGSFGYGVSLRAGKTGTWYCREHKP